MEIICTRCKKTKTSVEFLKNDKILKQCKCCREYNVKRYKKADPNQKEIINKEWRDNNKQRRKDYNKFYRESKLGINTKTWDEICKEKGYKNKCINNPSKHRKLHNIINGIVCKSCSCCKEMKSLDNYNNSSSSWDKLRTTCKSCLHDHRISQQSKDNRNKWYKNAMKNDPQFRARDICHKRILGALKNQNAKKFNNTMKLLDCSPSFLKEHLEKQFKEGMTWDNHTTDGWHIDHIRPCCSFDLTKKEQQEECFHYSNLQPLWATDNLKKGGTWEN